MAQALIFLAALSCFFVSASASAFDARPIPNEYEATTGTGLALNNTGAAATDAHAAVRVNPALLSTERAYSLNAGYHWPTSGRDFYQAAVVDGKTNAVAAGVSYTGYTEDYDPKEKELVAGVKSGEAKDSPVVRRGVIGVGQAFGRISAGIGATYVESHAIVEGDADVKGVGLNLGVAGAITPELRFGASLENASSRKIRDYAPRTIRAGMAYSFNENVMAYLDFRQRDRVFALEAPEWTLEDSAIERKAQREELEKNPERMAFASVSARVYDFFRLMGSYGQSVGDIERRALSGGAAVVNKNFSLTYTASRPYMARSTAHQAVSLGLDMAM